MAQAFGRELDGEVYVDSSAALGVVARKGNGKLRHIRVGQLWVQQVAEDETLTYKKVHGTENPADLCTKNVNHNIIDKALKKIDLEIRSGRAQESLELSRIDQPRVVGYLRPVADQRIDLEWERCSYGNNKVRRADVLVED